MFNKPVSELAYDDIVDLVSLRKEPEGLHLDYKKGIGNPNDFKKEIPKYVSAFANSSGGFLIWGITDEKEIVGIDPLFESKPVNEWVNKVLCSNIEPPVFYYEPKLIPIPQSEKILLVMHIPESINKPHYHTGSNSYYIRINDQKMPATHYNIRDMFEYSKYREDDLKSFLTEKHLYIESDPLFCQNSNTDLLTNDLPWVIDNWTFQRQAKLVVSQNYSKKPFVVFSLIPRSFKNHKSKYTIRELKNWMETFRQGYEPKRDLSLIRATFEYDTRADGIIFKFSLSEGRMLSYLEIRDNGYIEAGFSNTVSFARADSYTDNELVPYIMLTPLMVYQMALLGFAREFYSFVQNHDEIIFKLSFANVLNYKLTAINSWIDADSYRDVSKCNKHHNNLQLTEIIQASNLNYDEIMRITKQSSQKICNAFGADRDFCFDQQNQFDDENVYRIHQWNNFKDFYKQYQHE